jgi:hypothetical protein
MQSEKAPDTVKYDSAIESDNDESPSFEPDRTSEKGKKRVSAGPVPNEKKQKVEVRYQNFIHSVGLFLCVFPFFKRVWMALIHSAATSLQIQTSVVTMSCNTIHSSHSRIMPMVLQSLRETW